MLTSTGISGADANTNATILLIEDDPHIERTLSKALGANGYHVESAVNGADARALIPEVQPDLIILDLVLPDADGLILISTFQGLTRAPILICSARQRQVDRVLALKLGAADFVAKPFDLDELEARVEAILRRSASRPAERSQGGEIHVGDMLIAPSRALVKIAGQLVHLTPTEYRLLAALASEPEATFSREALTKRLWGYHDVNCNHLVDVHIGRLRLKLRLASPNKPYVVTVRGRGYRVTASREHDGLE